MFQDQSFEQTVNRAIVQTLVEKTQPCDTVKLLGPIPIEIALGVLVNGRSLAIQTGDAS